MAENMPFPRYSNDFHTVIVPAVRPISIKKVMKIHSVSQKSFSHSSKVISDK